MYYVSISRYWIENLILGFRPSRAFGCFRTAPSWRHNNHICQDSKLLASLLFPSWLIWSRNQVYICTYIYGLVDNRGHELTVLIAESFYSVKYGSLNITSIIPLYNLFCFCFPMFLYNLQYWHSLYWLGFNLKKKSCRKSKRIQSTAW